MAQLPEPTGGPIWLELTGPPGTREFLTHEIGDAAGDDAPNLREEEDRHGSDRPRRDP